MNVFDLAATLTLDSSEYDNKLGVSRDKTKSFSDKLGKGLKTASKVGAVAIASVGATAVASGKKIWNMANDTALLGDSIDKNSQKVGISAGNYQKWNYVFERSGANIDGLQVGMKKLSGVITNADKGSKSAQKSLQAVGLSVEDLNNKSQDEQLELVVSSLQKMEKGAGRTAAANALLGRASVDMAAVLNMTADETNALKKEAEDYGMVMSDEAVSASAGFEDSLTKLSGTAKGLKNRLAGELLPGLTSVIDGFSSLIAGSDGAEKQLSNGFSQVIKSLTSAIPKVIEVLGTLTKSLIAEAPTVFQSLIDGVTELLPELIPLVGQTIGTLLNALIEDIPNIVESLFSVLLQLADGIIEMLPDMIPKVIEMVMDLVQMIIDNAPAMIEAALQLIVALVEGFTSEESINKLIDGVVSIVDGIVKMITEDDMLIKIIRAGVKLFVSLVEKLPYIIEKITDAIPKIIDSIITLLTDTDTILEIGKAGITIFVALIKNLPQILVKIAEGAGKIIGKILSVIGAGVGKMVEIGGNLLKGLWEGIKNFSSWLWEKISGFFSGIWEGILNFFGIHSPSTLMRDKVGKMLALGLGLGFEDEMPKVIKGMQNALPDSLDTDLDVGYNVNPVSGLSAAENGASEQQIVYNNEVVINAEIRDGSDIDKLAEAVSDVLGFEFTERNRAYA